MNDLSAKLCRLDMVYRAMWNNNLSGRGVDPWEGVSYDRAPAYRGPMTRPDDDLSRLLEFDRRTVLYVFLGGVAAGMSLGFATVILLT